MKMLHWDYWNGIIVDTEICFTKQIFKMPLASSELLKGSTEPLASSLKVYV